MIGASVQNERNNGLNDDATTEQANRQALACPGMSYQIVHLQISLRTAV